MQVQAHAILFREQDGDDFMTKEKDEHEEERRRKAIRRWEEEPFEITRHLDKVFQRFIGEFEDTFRMWPMRWKPFFPDVRLPLCDVCDLGDKYSITMEVPGIEREKIDVSVNPNNVVVKAEIRAEEEKKGINYIYKERKHKMFHRNIDLPEEVVPPKAEAKMHNGVLEIILPKKVPRSEEKAVKLDIK